jgi:DNA-binding GntR family transcriptional regulator
MSEDNEAELAALDPEKLSRAQQENPFIKISEAVYSILEEAILSSALKPGSKLKINKIADELKVSGTPVREAVEQLVTRGLVVESLGAGGKYKNYYVFDIDDGDIEDLFAARKSIESTAAYLCAQRSWYVDMDFMDRNTEAFLTSVKEYIGGGSVRNATMCDREFHTMIVEYSRNRYLREMYATLDKKLNYLSVRTCEFMAASLRRDNLLMLCSQHSLVLHAIRIGHPQLARQAMDDHIDFCAGNCLSSRYFSESQK